MATEHVVDQVEEMALNTVDDGPWSGGESPMKASYGKLMMWYFLLSDAFTFAGFLIAYGSLRFAMPSWPVPDFVFQSFPFLSGHYPLLFVTFMTFVLIVSSVTMVRSVQEGHRENKNGAAYWLLLTILGGATFLGCQAFEWYTLIVKENMTLTVDPFGTHTTEGILLDHDGKETEAIKVGETYLLHKAGGHGHGDDHGSEAHPMPTTPGDYPGFVIDEGGFILPKYKVTQEGHPDKGEIKTLEYGPKAFGALFFFITGFHGFHVFSGLVILVIILINVMSGLYVERKNGYEMVEKVGLYWHFVDLVWVFVFLVFYLL